MATFSTSDITTDNGTFSATLDTKNWSVSVSRIEDGRAVDAGTGWWDCDRERIVDCPADLGEEVYEALEDDLSEQLADWRKAAAAEHITVVMDGPNGPYVEYGQDDDAEVVDPHIPDGWWADYSSQITADSGLYRAPLVRDAETTDDGKPCYLPESWNPWEGVGDGETWHAYQTTGGFGIIGHDDDWHVVYAEDCTPVCTGNAGRWLHHVHVKASYDAAEEARRAADALEEARTRE